MDRSPAFWTIFILLQIYTDSLGRNLRGLCERFPLLEPDFQPLSWSLNRCFGKNKWVSDPFLSFFPACPVSFLYEDLYRDLKRARNKWRKTRFPPGQLRAFPPQHSLRETRLQIAGQKKESVKAKIHRFCLKTIIPSHARLFLLPIRLVYLSRKAFPQKQSR